MSKKGYERLFLVPGRDMHQKYDDMWFDFLALRVGDHHMTRINQEFFYQRPKEDDRPGTEGLAIVTTYHEKRPDGNEYIAVRLDPQVLAKGVLDPIYDIIKNYGLVEIEEPFKDDDSLDAWIKKNLETKEQQEKEKIENKSKD